MLPTLRQRMAPFARTIGTTGGLVTSTVVTSATGFVFWWLAARLYPASAVGLAGAAVSAMLLLSQLSVLGLGTALAGALHREARPASLVVTALAAAGTAGCVAGILFALATPWLSAELAPIAETPLHVVLFAAGVGLTAISAVLDQSLVAALRSSYQLIRNSIFAVVRLALLAVFVAMIVAQGMTIYAAWIAATALSLAIVVLLPRIRRPIGDLLPLPWRRLSGMAFGALAHHVLNLSRSAGVWLLPVLVTALLSRETNAAFYVALLLANFVALVGNSATFTLYVVGARAPHELWRQMRVTLGISGLAAVTGTLGLALLGPLLVGAFGAAYADAYPTVAILALSTLPLVIKDHWIALQRLRGGVGRAALIGIMTLTAELAAATIGASLAGIIGLAIARFAVLLVQALFMLRPVVAAIRRPDGPGPDGVDAGAPVP